MPPLSGASRAFVISCIFGGSRAYSSSVAEAFSLSPSFSSTCLPRRTARYWTSCCAAVSCCGDRKAEQKRRIEKYTDAIDNLLGWESETATHRIVGNIRRLNREGVPPESLKQAYLNDADLKDANLSETSVHEADLSGG